jgi:hypothetical protein
MPPTLHFVNGSGQISEEKYAGDIWRRERDVRKGAGTVDPGRGRSSRYEAR